MEREWATLLILSAALMCAQKHITNQQQKSFGTKCRTRTPLPRKPNSFSHNSCKSLQSVNEDPLSVVVRGAKHPKSATIANLHK